MLAPHYILGAMATGIGATLIMDLWNLFLKLTFSIPSLNYCLLGRWLGHMPEGTLRHASILAAPAKAFECAVGWIAHYTIGVVFALVFVVIASGDWLARPTLPPARYSRPFLRNRSFWWTLRHHRAGPDRSDSFCQADGSAHNY